MFSTNTAACHKTQKQIVGAALFGIISGNNIAGKIVTDLLAFCFVLFFFFRIESSVPKSW